MEMNVFRVLKSSSRSSERERIETDIGHGKFPSGDAVQMST